MPLFLLIFSLSVVSLGAAYTFWRLKYGPPGKGFPSVLAYHKIDGFELSGTWISPGRFAAHIDYLLDSGFNFINEDAFIEVMEGRRARSPGELLLTFDDGYRDLLYTAAPILERRSVPALAFIVTSFVGRENSWELNLPGRSSRHLDWGELEELRGMGFSLGSHTATHPDLTRIDTDRMREELIVSRGKLEEQLRIEIKSLSYPFGRVNRVIRNEAERAGYRIAFSMYPPLPNGRSDPLMLRRDGVYLIDNVYSLRNKLTGGRFFWLEDLKGRMINGVSVLTPVIKGLGSGRADRL